MKRSVGELNCSYCGPRDPRGARLVLPMGTRGSARMRPCFDGAAAYGYTPDI